MEADQPLQELSRSFLEGIIVEVSLLLKMVHLLILITITRVHKDHEEDLVNLEQLEPL